LRPTRPNASAPPRKKPRRAAVPDEQPWYRAPGAFSNPLASAMRLIDEMLRPPEATAPTPEQVEARRQRDARLALTQEAEHATAPLWQQTLENLGDAAWGYTEGVIGASDELYAPYDPNERRDARLVGRLIGESGLDVLGAAAPLAGAVGRLKARALKGGMYSRVEDIAAQIPAKGIHPQRLASQLKSGASSEEVAARQIPEFLARQGERVTPEAVEAHLAAHPAPFPEVKTLGAHPELIAREQAIRAQKAESARELGPHLLRPDIHSTQRGNAMWWAREAARGEEVGTANLKAVAASPEAYEIMVRHGRLLNEEEAATYAVANAPNKAKFAQYQLPGGENYQERLLTLPRGPVSRAAYAKEYLDFDPQATPEIIDQAYARHLAGQGPITVRRGDTFTAGHWDEPDVLVHVRHNDRTLPTGERGRFLEEVQSDWHQKGKKEGYQDPAKVQALKQAEDRLSVARRAQADAYERLRERVELLGNPKPDDAPEDVWALRDAWREATLETNIADTAYRDAGRQTGSIPDAPFKESWPDLALKQQLAEVADDPNISWLGFTDGKTQADRYNLRKQVDSVHYVQKADGTYHLRVLNMQGNPVIDRVHMTPDELEATIGKEMTERIVAGHGQKAQSGWRRMSGLDLEVGGEGMKKFYDELLPKRLEKLVKPFGGTVERGSVMAGVPQDKLSPEQRRTLGGAMFDDVLKRVGTVYGGRIPMGPNARLVSREDAVEGFVNEALGPRDFGQLAYENVAKRGIPTPGWVVRLTPEMKAKIKAGLPLMAIPAAVAVHEGQKEPQ
jgi:hypothetical protein